MVKTFDATTTDRLRRSPLHLGLSPSCARKRACMELTTICRFQRLKIPLFDFFSAFDISRPRQITDIQHGITIMGGREVSRPYQIVFFAEGERFLSFWRCHRPRKRAALGLWCV